ncbi:GNAT family N-acetyltransferase [Halosegnis marinus]|uniref:GNAT family N-acetyltransferase n=1 Tax=Halosegnis marinus TaxID=3034023 RepID=A0ABD5ZRR4_9EURY|nr:GNAT family N-acetyltransferase [Halosegnis sp. DT85]
MDVRPITMDEWRAALPDTGTEPFHTPEALGVLDDHADADLELYAGFNGDRAVALLPVFVSEPAVGRAVTSPPPGFGVPRLGPVLNPASPKRRKREKRNAEFTEGVLDALGVDRSGTLFRMVTATGYPDPRPYTWAGLDTAPAFTYQLDTADRSTDEVRAGFSKSLRREIGDAEELDIAVTVEGVEAARAVYDATAERYAEQDREFALDWPYVRDLVEALGERARVYVVRDGDGEFLAGVTVLYSDELAYFWQGGVRTVYEGVSVNSLLHWRIVADLVAEPPLDTLRGYDLMGANTERLCRYKSKFGASLVPYYRVESAGRSMDVAKRVYNLVGR